MRWAQACGLIGAALLVGITFSPMLWAYAATPSAARLCATQTPDLANRRIAACTSLLDWGRLRGEPKGVAYALRGLAYLDRGDIPAAISDLNQAVTLAPDFAPAYQNRGNAWFARGNYGQAIADYDATIKLDPNSPSPYVNRGVLRYDLGYNSGALADFDKAISLSPTHAPAYSGRGELYLRQHDDKRAIDDFNQAIQLAPSVKNYMLRARARADSGDLDGAIADYRQAEQLDPKSVTAINAEGNVWRKKGDLDQATAAYSRALAVDPRRTATYKLRAEAYAAKGERRRAMADIGRALKFSWQADLLAVRGKLRLDGGDAAGAVHDANAMLKLKPGDTDALTLRAEARLSRKDYDGALADLNKAIAADGKNAPAYGERGQVYLVKGDTDRALDDLNRAIALGATSPALYSARAQIMQDKAAAEAATKAAAETAATDAPAQDIHTAAVPLPPVRDDGKPVEKAKAGAAKPVVSVASAPAADVLGKTATPEDKTPAQTSTAPPPKNPARVTHKSHENKTVAPAQATTTEWTDEYGRPLSQREIREIKRALRESDERRSGHAGSPSTFDEIWR